MLLIIDTPKDYGDGLRWWDMAFGAGYPDWLITSPLPPVRDGERWVWTGRCLVPLPTDLFRFWWDSHFQPVSLKQLRNAFTPHIGVGDSATDLAYVVFKSGLFVTWPWGLEDVEDTPDAIGIRANIVAKPENPLPDIIPDDEWNDVIPMNRLVNLWAEARERGHIPGGLYDAVQDLVRSRRAWFVAQPVRGLTTGTRNASQTT